MRILVVGNGAREDALSWRLAQSPRATRDLRRARKCRHRVARDELEHFGDRTAKRSSNGANAEKHRSRRARPGSRRLLQAWGTVCATRVLRSSGRTVRGGRLESSKIFAKHFMERHGVPTARASSCIRSSGAMKALDEWTSSGVVVKADGLAAGKGVVVCERVDEARDGARRVVLGKQDPRRRQRRAARREIVAVAK